MLARVCLALDLLHREGVVFGDLSDRSVLYGAGEVASALLIGCEGAVFAGDGVEQRNSAGWAAPESADEVDAADAADAALSTARSVQSAATDLFKLGLLVLRVLAPSGDGLERSRDADRVRGVLDETGQRMMRDALGDDPARRPTASDWYAYLRAVIVESLSAPVISRVDVSPALVAEGDEVRLEVEVSGARQLVIEMPGRADITREVGSRLVLERFTARQSGRIGVRAVNDHGSAEAVSSPVRVLPVPAPTRIAVAAPAVPEALGVLADLAPLEAAMGISLAPVSGGGGRGRPESDAPSAFDRVAELRAQLEADALPLHDLLQLGLEAERASRSRDALFPSFEEFFGDITGPDRRR